MRKKMCIVVWHDMLTQIRHYKWFKKEKENGVSTVLWLLYFWGILPAVTGMFQEKETSSYLFFLFVRTGVECDVGKNLSHASAEDNVSVSNGSKGTQAVSDDFLCNKDFTCHIVELCDRGDTLCTGICDLVCCCHGCFFYCYGSDRHEYGRRGESLSAFG